MGKRKKSARMVEFMSTEDFLTRVNEVQSEERHRTIPIVQLIILFELWKAKERPVPLLDIQYKYNFERFTLSRNSEMLADARIRGSQGKGWITKTLIKGNDKRMKEAKLTKIGSIFAERLFG
jgi:hypothetical protein